MKRPHSVDIDSSAGHTGTVLDLALRHRSWPIARDLLERGESATRTQWAKDALRITTRDEEDEDLDAVRRLVLERLPGIMER